MANGNRPADKDVGDSKVAPKLEPTSEQKSDGKLNPRPADKTNTTLDQVDPASLEAEANSEINKGIDDSFINTGGAKYPVDFKGLTKVQESIESVVSEAKKRINENSEFSLDKDLNSLLESEGLSEETKTKFITIFESYVNVASKEHLKSMTECLEDTLLEAIDKIQEEFDENVSKCVDYGIKEWILENKIAIEKGVRTQIAESFMEGLKSLLESHYVEVPEGKEDVLEMEIQKSSDLENKLNEQIEKNIELVEENKKIAKDFIIENIINNSELTLVQKDKLRNLSESVELTSIEDFKLKINSLVEHVSSDKAKPSNKSLITEDENGGIDVETPTFKRYDKMDEYVSFMKR